MAGGSRARGTKRRLADENDPNSRNITPVKLPAASLLCSSSTPNKSKRPRLDKSLHVASYCKKQQKHNNTPHVKRSGHKSSHLDSGTPTNSIQMERNEEAIRAAEAILEDKRIPDVAIPHEPASSAASRRILKLVTSALEKYITIPLIIPLGLEGDYNDMLALVRTEIMNGNNSRRRGLRGNGRRDTSKARSNVMPESEMYCPISALLTFIADAIDAAAQEVLRKTIAQKTIDALGTKRRIVPFRKTDSNPKGSDDYHRIDLGLRVVDEAFSDISPKSASKPDYTDMLAVIEVKTDIGKQQSAYQQLFEYSRNIYVNQHDRRFVWGLTVCGAVFRVCLINNDRMLASDPMDVTRPDGRMSLAKWLVNMSFCEKDKLGHDPTVYYNMESAKWEIVVFDDHLERGSMVFQIESCTRIADRAFGRHTRCFECTQIALEPGSADDSNRNSNSQSSFISQQAAKVIVKDAWAIGTNAPADKLRDEVALLREISNKLADRDGLAGKYPTLLAGGVVKQTGKGDKLFNDNSSNVFAALGNKILKEIGTFRVHKRLAMTPIAQDIRHVNSVDELIIAAADAMQAYCEIWGTCEILHRDISTNNILISRYKDVDNRIKVRGMLIDFDCALHVDMSSKRDIRPEMTGTYPFMSINNLANTDVERTPLDDWESIIYVLCWLGTIGVNYEDEEEREESGPAFSTLPIFKWSEGLAAQVASAKRTDMHSHENFRSRIVKRFLNRDSYKPLRHLVMALRQTLINNRKMSSMGQGAFEDNDDDDSDMDFAFARESSGSANISNSGRSFWDDGFKKNETLFDPNECFARRAYCADKISKELLQVILDAREKAVARLF